MTDLNFIKMDTLGPDLSKKKNRIFNVSLLPNGLKTRLGQNQHAAGQSRDQTGSGTRLPARAELTLVDPFS